MKRLCVAALSAALAQTAYAADQPTVLAQASPPPPTLQSAIPPLQGITPTPPACTGIDDFFSTKCSLSAYGVQVYGTVDAGAAWQSHGVPLNNHFTDGLEYLVNKNLNKPIWSFAPNGLSQSNIGIKGVEPIAYGVSFVFDLEAGFDPYSFQFANGPYSLIQQNGIPLNRQSSDGDSSRAGQFYNALGWAGLASPDFGTLTVGRQNSLSIDGIIAYDPMGASYAFSPIGYSGVAGGAGDTEDARYTTALKYKVAIDNFRVSGLWQFGDYANGNPSTGAYEGQVGGDFLIGPGKLSADFIYTYVDNAVSAAALSAAQNKKYPGQLAATLSNDSAEQVLAKYGVGPATTFLGYEHILYTNPGRGRSSFLNIGGYTISEPNINVTAYDIHKELHIIWGGLKYAVTPDVFLTGAYYQYVQPSYAKKNCSDSSLASCSGQLRAISALADWQVLPKLDLYTGVMFSAVDNGLANGYIHHVTADPMVGARFRF